jgi:eukaryotic-like serine/threonine-protein kinase
LIAFSILHLSVNKNRPSLPIKLSMIKNFFLFFKSKAFLINLGIAIVVLPLLFWIIFACLGSYTRHNETVDVPDFKDLKIKQLDDFVKDKEMGYEIIDSLWDPTLQKGVVIRQEPEAGAKIKEGRKVYLYVTATTPPMIAMPKLEDLSVRQAVAVCESYGLKSQISYVNDPCNGCVVKQLYNKKRIEPGTPIRKGETISIEAGKGEDNSGGGFAVPKLIGLSFRAARGKMTDLGLDWVLIADPGIKDTLNATVYQQEPMPGNNQRLIAGSTIDLYITNNKSKADSAADGKNP